MFSPEKAIEAGRSILGMPYKLGGNLDYRQEKPKGPVDCSGFVLWCLARGGLTLPDMTAQGLYDLSYPTGIVKPCDLGFQKEPGHGVDHVVMMTDDPDVVIEARGCKSHLGHTPENCPYNKVILRPRVKWEAWHKFTGFRRLRDIDIANGLPG
jgi:hypothetical protein